MSSSSTAEIHGTATEVRERDAWPIVLHFSPSNSLNNLSQIKS